MCLGRLSLLISELLKQMQKTKMQVAVLRGVRNVSGILSYNPMTKEVTNSFDLL